MRFEWDATKATANLCKHGVFFDVAMEVWNHPLHVIFPIASKTASSGGMRWA